MSWWQRQPRLVGALKFLGVERDGLAHFLADLRDDFTGNPDARRRAHLLQFLRLEREGLALCLGQGAVQFLLRRRDALFLQGARGFQRFAKRHVERPAHVVEVKAQVIARMIFRQHAALAIQNFSAHRRQPDGAKLLRFQMRLIIARRDDLHPPQPDEQNQKPAHQHHRHEAELEVVLFEFVKNEHGFIFSCV